eukprot:Nitzschia sp. Nitz4//scaffold161_size51353//35345//36755//NITZ4_006954-RA/size51353-processed-gene-0.62-mRNA-1//1//CDS//3329537927//496//frame0
MRRNDSSNLISRSSAPSTAGTDTSSDYPIQESTRSHSSIGYAAPGKTKTTKLANTPVNTNVAAGDADLPEEQDSKPWLDSIQTSVEPWVSRGTSMLRTLQQRIPVQKINGKKIVMATLVLFFVVIIFEAFFVAPEDRLLQPDFADQFLAWVQQNPSWGLGAIMLVIAAAVVTMVPIGTPLTLGCGYIYRGVYGWKLGLVVATVVSMLGSCLGAVVCFLLGRYLMRETVQNWVRKYPLFDAINVAAKEQGLKIMAMLYLTPVIPLGLVSYMCGTTSMNIYAFAAAKVFSLPLYLIYTFIGASAHSFLKRGQDNANAEQAPLDISEQAKQLEENESLIISGILLSVVMMTLLTRHIRKELMKILEQQKKDKPGDDNSDENVATGGDDGAVDDLGVEMGLTARRRGAKAEMND